MKLLLMLALLLSGSNAFHINPESLSSIVPNGSLDGAKSAIKSGSLKIAFIGDSITEGAYLSDPKSSYANLVVESIKEKLPDTKIEYKNFAIGGTISLYFNLTNYLAASNTTPSTFYREWGEIGKSWHDNVMDYKPDLLIIAFGMNDASSTEAANGYKENIKKIIVDASTWSSHPSIVLVSTIYPTDDPLKTTEKQETVSFVVSKTRQLALENGVAFADANYIYENLRRNKTYTESELIGNFGEVIDGNGINHPTPLIHKIVYFKAFETIVDELIK